MKKRGIFIFLIFLVFGLYFINSSFSFITLPKFIFDFENWITAIGGILIIVGGFNYLRASRKQY